MIAALLLSAIGAGPIELQVDACLAPMVDTASVAALLELELAPRTVAWVEGAAARIECADAPEAVAIKARQPPIVLALHDIGAPDRARAIALAFAEELRLREEAETPLSLGSEPAPGGPRIETLAPAPVEHSPWAMTAETSLIKPINDTAFVIALSAAAQDTDGLIRPRLGGTACAGHGDQKDLIALAIDLGATLVFVETESISLGLDASASVGLFANDQLGPFGLLLGGLLFQLQLSDGLALQTRVAAGSFVPSAATALFSLGLAVVP